MAELRANQKSFLDLMGKSDEHLRRGFELLSSQAEPELFFEEIAQRGLFDGANNPAPIPAGDNLVSVPFWPALLYLSACAKRSDVLGDLALARAVLGIVRSVTNYRQPGEEIRDNYHTFREFAGILGAVPPAAVSETDVDLVSTWLSSKYDRSGVAGALDKGAIGRFLASDDTEGPQKAVRLLRHCLAVEWVPDPNELEAEKLHSRIDPYWLRELLTHHAASFGRRAGLQAATTLQDAVRFAFSRGARAELSFLFRPAVEDHSQNQDLGDVDDCLVEGLRDTLLAWIDSDATGSEPFVRSLLRSDVEMLRRIGLFALDARWAVLGQLYGEFVSPQLFSRGHIHELYGLLKRHFDDLPNAQKHETRDAILNLQGAAGADAEARLHMQRRWLSALVGTTYLPVAALVAQLKANDPTIVGDHPDFNTYGEMSSGPGRSPYKPQELIAFLEQGSIIEKLNAFVEERSYRAPTTYGLAAALQEAVASAPEQFGTQLMDFCDVAGVYQNAVINSFRQLWNSAKTRPTSLDWDRMWHKLVDFFAALAPRQDDDVLDEEASIGDTTWSVADFIKAGMDDEQPMPEGLLPRTWDLLATLLGTARAIETVGPDDDPMTQAINTPKGRVIEAIYSQVLRECRAADKAGQAHTAAWTQREALFDREIQQCKNGNYEFSTLAGAYFSNLEYLDFDWLRRNVGLVFPADQPSNFLSAMGGFAYAQVSKRGYALLRDTGVVDRALETQLVGRETRKQLLEKVALGYLWEQESLESPRFLKLFEAGSVGDLEIVTWFFSSLRRQKLSERQTAKIVAYWRRAIQWARQQTATPKTFYARLSSLAVYLADAEGQSLELLVAVAPFVTVDQSEHGFIAQLSRLADQYPEAVDSVVGVMVQSNPPTYDYEGRLKQLVGKLASLGRRESALKYCNQLRDIPSMAELFVELQGGEGAAPLPRGA